ncbi:MAG: membrane protein insertase YidC [Rhodocyclaceae bacterium]|nr:membrane protein insertase YidC [Rhodocyclaceae bacterium]
MDNQRLILLLVFFFSLMMLWSNWQQWQQPAQKAASAPPGALPLPSPTALPAGSPEAPTPSSPSETAKTLRVRTDLVVADIAEVGGDLVRLELLRHKATGKKDENFLLFEPKHAYRAQSGLIGSGLPNHKTRWQLPQEGELSLKEGENTLRVALFAPLEGGGKVVKTYVFRRGSYLVDVEHRFEGAFAPAPVYAYYQFVRDDQPPEGVEGFGIATFTGAAIYTEQEKFKKVEFKDFGDVKKHPARADNGWLAMVQHYFFAAWLPQGEREYFTRKLDGKLYAAGVIVPIVGDAVTVPLYAGPQEQSTLDSIAPGLSLVVDYGWLTFIAAPLFWVLEWLYQLVGNWGWAIILLTVLIKAAFYPLSAASYKSMAKMRVLTPKLMQIKETYADDRMRMNQEMMELYKREKVNPLGGCLPILVQIPVFIALYWVLLGTVEMRGAPWLGWIEDLSAKDPYFILPILMGATMFVQTKLNPTPPDPIQAKVMLWMPIIFTVMFLWFPSGLVLYWTVNNLLSIAQQWQVNRMIERAGLKTY